jgi:hypothetical protein
VALTAPFWNGVVVTAVRNAQGELTVTAWKR